MSAAEQPIVHTPGPWKYHDAGAIVMTEDGQMSVADIRGFGKLEASLGTSQAIKVMDANGRLIAAAPDMLEALREIAGLRWGWDGDCGATGIAISAIEKATGQSIPHDI